MNTSSLRSNQTGAAGLIRYAHGPKRGAMLPLVAVTLVGLLAVLAIAIDGGNMQQQRRLAQNAADAAAQAGAAEIFRTYTDTATVFAAARTEAARNGFTTGTNGVRVIVSTPVSPDRFTGNQYVKVVIEDTVRTSFAGILRRSSAIVRARAWGGVVTPSTTCVAILAPSGADALLFQNGSDLTATDCKITVNSTSSSALDWTSGTVVDASSISLSGGHTGSGSCISSDPSYTCTVQTNQPPVGDPLASVVTPSYSTTCMYTNLHVTNTATLNPGTYCSNSSSTAALWLDGGSGDVITLNPGLYVMMGGGLRASHQGTINGTGVSFLNTNGPGNNANALGIFNFETGVTANLSAMTTGNLAGILFYLDRTAGNATTLAVTNNFQTAGSSNFTGTMYFPTQPVWFHTASNTVVTGSLVAYTARFSQDNTNVSFTGNGGGGTGFAALKRASVVQ